MKIETTFTKLREGSACTRRYKHLVRKLGGITKYGKDTPITLLQILDSNGIADTLFILDLCVIDAVGKRLLKKFVKGCIKRTRAFNSGGNFADRAWNIPEDARRGNPEEHRKQTAELRRLLTK